MKAVLDQIPKQTNTKENLTTKLSKTDACIKLHVALKVASKKALLLDKHLAANPHKAKPPATRNAWRRGAASAGHVKFFKEWMPTEGSFVYDASNARYQLHYPGESRKSFAWTKRRQTKSVLLSLQWLAETQMLYGRTAHIPETWFEIDEPELPPAPPGVIAL